MKSLTLTIALLLTLSTLSFCQELQRPPTTIANVQDTHEKRASRLWLVSMGALVAASGADAATSWGKREDNPLLRSQNGTFGAKGLTIKAGITGVLLVPQIVLRGDHGMRRRFTFANAAMASMFAGIAMHNSTVPVR